MNITLEHPAIKNISEEAWKKLLSGLFLFSTFSSRINRLAEKIEKCEKEESNPYFNESGKDASNKFKGDVFEIFVELMIRLSPIDDRIGISDYHVVTGEDDIGVDGYGTATDRTPATVQIKFRQWDKILDHNEGYLNNFRLASYNKYRVSPKAEGKMLIVTAGKEINWKTLDRQFQGAVKVIARSSSYGCIRGAQKHTVDSLFSIKTIVDNNNIFWDLFREKVGI